MILPARRPVERLVVAWLEIAEALDAAGDGALQRRLPAFGAGLARTSNRRVHDRDLLSCSDRVSHPAAPDPGLGTPSQPTRHYKT